MSKQRWTVLVLVIPFLLLVIGAFQTVDAAALKAMPYGDSSYLTDSNGRTLYIFTKDAAGKSTCVDQCVMRWPVFYTEKIMVSSGMDAKEFGVITHPSGQMQNTFRGWPLYYFMSDMTPGEMKGQGINGAWFIVLNPMSK